MNNYVFDENTAETCLDGASKCRHIGTSNLTKLYGVPISSPSLNQNSRNTAISAKYIPYFE